MTTINYFNVGIYKDEEKTSIKFKDILDLINDDLWNEERELDNWNRRVRTIDSKVATIFKPIVTNKSTSNNIEIVPMGEFRLDDKPYTGEIRENNFEELPSNIIELCTFVTIKDDYLLILEHNHRGLKKGDIEKYFNTYLPDNFKVVLEPLISRQTREILDRTGQITELDLEINTNVYNRHVIEEYIREEEANSRSLIGNLINKISTLIESSKDLDIDEMYLKYKVKYAKDATMNLEMVRSLVDVLDLENNALEKIELKYNNPRTDKLSKIDLKNLEIDLKDKLNIIGPNPAPGIIGDDIIENSNIYRGEINRNMSEFIVDANIYVDIPELFYEPREEHRYRDNSES